MSTPPFWPQVDKSGACWLWVGSVDRDGYGKYRRAMAHRIAYELLVGPIADGLQIDHLCRVRNCVNPAHLEPVTPSENQRRAVGTTAKRNAAKTECPQGHPYDTANTYVRTNRSGRPERYCRTCARGASRRARQRRAA